MFSENTQLQEFGKKAFITLLPVALQACPKLGKKENFWNYLKENFPSSLKEFEGLDIVPVVTETGDGIWKLTSGQPWLVVKGLAPSSGVTTFLKRLGIKLILSIPDFAMHKCMFQYLCFEQRGLVRCLELLTSTKIGHLKKIPKKDKEEFREFLADIYLKENIPNIGGTLKKILKHLPIFKTLELSENSGLTSIQAAEGALCEIPPYDLKQVTLLDMRQKNVKFLFRLLEVKEQSLSSLIQKFVLPVFTNMSALEQENWSLYILRNLSNLHYQERGIKEKMKCLPFVKSLQPGSRDKPSAMYDPQDKNLKLLAQPSKIPCDIYKNDLQVLQELGMATSSTVTKEDIQSFMSGISNELDPNRKQLVYAFIELVNQRHDLLKEKFFGETLDEVKWIPVRKSHPQYPRTLNWKGSTAEYAKPTEVLWGSEENLYVAGSVAFFVDSEIATFSQNLRKWYNWDRKVAVDDILNHLKHMVDNYNKTDKALYEISYGYLCAAVKPKIAKMPSHQINIIKDRIWYGNGFTSVDHVVNTPALPDLQPYIYELPEYLQKYSNLFSFLGLEDTCNLSVVLQWIKKHHEDSECSKIEVDRDRKIAVSILSELVYYEDPTIMEKILIPVQNNNNTRLQLEVLKQCTYHPSQWRHRLNTDSLDIPEGVWLVHQDVPEKIVRKLKVAPLNIQKLNPESLEFESFGQREPLTLRISNILKNYKDGFAVPKELIQNADDAGASDFKFLFDCRENRESVTSLFDPGMEECQGPALWAYNNAEFTDEDFKNIIRLGSGSKEMKNDKVGRFGLGFNAVYNLTDVPSFVSGNHLVVFDPHAKYLGECITNNNPGIRVKMSKDRVATFKDQFKPYEGLFECSPTTSLADNYHYNGTLFRLPLRSKEQADDSEISKLFYNEREVKLLVDKLIEGASTLLLFTQNVETVSFHILDKQDEPAQMKLYFHITKAEMQNVLPARLGVNQVHNVLKEAAEAVKSGKRQNISSVMTIKVTTEFQEAGALFKPPGRSIDEHFWLLCDLSGTNKAYDEAVRRGNLVPLAGVAVELEKCNGFYSCKQTKGQMFCFLPLPVPSGLPVHINGFFAVSQDRRRIEQGTVDDKSCEDGNWNNLLLEEIVKEAYIKVLLCTSQFCTEVVYYELWPQYTDTTANMKCLLDGFYTQIATDQDIALFSDGSNWVSLENAVYISDHEFRDTNIKTTAKKILGNNLSDKTVVEFPDELKQRFFQAGVGSHVSKCFYSKQKFFEDIFLPNINSLDNNERDPLLKMALHDYELSHLLADVACIPTLPYGRLKKPKELIHPAGRASKLFTDQDERFPFDSDDSLHSYSDMHSLLQLERLGMMKDTIGWEDIIAKSRTVCSLGPEDGLKLFQGLMDMIFSQQNRSDESETEQHVNIIRTVAFLPVKHTTKESCMKWYVDEHDVHFTSWVDGFSSHQWQDVVCYVAPIIDDDNFSHRYKLKDIFTSTKVPTVSQALEQHKHLRNFNLANVDKRQYNDHISKCCLSIYMHLNKTCSDPDSSLEEMKQYFKQTGLWIESMFVLPDICAKRHYERCSPWLNSIPGSMIYSCEKFCEAIEVKDEFSVGDYIKCLSKIKSCYVNTCVEKETVDVAVKIVGCLAASLDKDKSSETIQELEDRYGVVYIPDDQGYMRACSEVCFGDEESCKFIKKNEDTYFAHPDLSFRAGKMLHLLGIKTLRQHVVAKESEGIPFGQHEPLTRRIKRLLQSYPFDAGILKEMVQNADDAGATEIHFILDEREHKTDQLLCNSWKELQGPALIVYNNAEFSQKDLDGIKELGLGSKSSDSTKTGQYGVGFNCVYHITDTPTFLTTIPGKGEVLVVFDPNLKNIEGATIAAPGKLYKTEKLRETFPNVFSPYNLQGKDCCYRNGTLFRLPLRSRNQAENSELSDKEMKVSEMKHLFDTFKNEVRNVSLFLNSINKIAISVVQENDQVHHMYCIETSMIESDSLERQKFIRNTITDATALRSNKLKLSGIVRKEISSVMKIKDNFGQEEKWAIVQSFGFSDLCIVEKSSVNDAYSRGEIHMLPRGGVAAFLGSHSHMSKHAKTDMQGNAHSDQFKEHRSKRFLYCFLPLPIEMNLPVHLNGHFCLDNESRRHLWSDEGLGFRTEWNNMLMEHLIAPSYVRLLKDLQVTLCKATQPGTSIILVQTGSEGVANKNVPTMDEAKMLTRKYNKLFPILRKSADGYIEKMTRAVYKYIEDGHQLVMPVFRKTNHASVNLEWFPFTKHAGREAVIRDLWLADNDTLELRVKNEQCLYETLYNSGYNFFFTSNDIIDSCDRCGIKLQTSKPHHILEFYKQNEDTCLVQQGYHVENTCLACCHNVALILEFLSKTENFNPDMLEDTPLLVTKDGIVRIFSKKASVYWTQFHDLVPGRPELFIHPDLLQVYFKWSKFQSEVIQAFSMKALSGMLPDMFSAQIYNSCRGYMACNPWESQIKPKWLQLFWHFLKTSCAEAKRDLQAKNMKVEDEELTEMAYRQTVEPVASWCFIPGISAGGNLFVPLCKPYLLVNLQQSKDDCDRTLKMAFSRLQLPNLLPSLIHKFHDNTEIYQIENEYLTSLVSTVNRKSQLLKALQEWTSFRDSVNQSIKFDKDEEEAILNYFFKCLEDLKQEPKFKETVKKLPIFRNLKNESVQLNLHQFCLIPSKIIPVELLGCIGQEKDVIFLHPDVRENDRILMKELGVDCPTEIELYIKIILPNFHKYEKSIAWKHIAVILKLWKQHKQLQGKTDQDANFVTFMQTLESSEFIPCGEKFASAKTFYDPGHPVFQTMLPVQDKFPPCKLFHFFKDDWITLLKEIGLIKEVTKELFIEFVKKVETDAADCENQEQFTHLETQCKVLLQNLYYEQRDFHDLAQKIKEVNFVPLIKISAKLASLCQQHGNRYLKVFPFTSLNEGIVGSHTAEKLIWASTKLLPAWVEPKEYKCPGNSKEWRKRALCNNLGLNIGEIPFIQVVKNIENVCYSVQDKMDQSQWSKENKEVLMDVLHEHYTYFEKHMNAQNIKTLAKKPCVLVDEGERLVKPSQISITMSEIDQIMPYLYKLPTDWGRYHRLFTELGASKTPTVKQYLTILEELQVCYQNEKVEDPNDQTRATRVLFALMLLFKNDEEVSKSDTLFVMSAAGIVSNITDLCYIDSDIFRNRISKLDGELVAPFGNMELIKQIKDHPEWKNIYSERDDIFKLFPDTVKPKKLSDYCKEKLCEVKNMNVPTDYVHGLKKRFHTNQFMGPLRSLLKNNESAADDLLDKAMENLQKCDIVSVSDLRTELIHKGNPVPDSETDIPCYIDKKEDPVTIYINKDMEFEAEIFLPDRLNRELLFELANTHILSQILKHELSRIPEILKQFQIKVDLDSESFKTLPLCGDFIPGRLHCWLVQKIEILHPGDYVGFMLCDVANAGNNIEMEDDENTSYVYARIIEERTPPETDLINKQYLIDVGGSRREIVPIFELYRFQKKNELAPSEKVEIRKDLVPVDQDDTPEVIWKPLDEQKDEIRKELESAWNLSESEKKTVVRRLLRQWHPDKNPGNEEYCTKICQFIQTEIRRLDKGEPTSKFTDTTFNTFYEHAGTWARNQHQQQERYRREFREHHYHFTDNQPPPPGPGPNPQKAEARRWIQQAKYDLHAAPTDMGNELFSRLCNYEWACFKLHQVS